jgi:hypothetical protein
MKMTRTMMISQPMGVPNEYVVEFFAPTLDQYEVFHNVGLAGNEHQNGVENGAAVNGAGQGDATPSVAQVAKSTN